MSEPPIEPAPDGRYYDEFDVSVPLDQRRILACATHWQSSLEPAVAELRCAETEQARLGRHAAAARHRSIRPEEGAGKGSPGVVSAETASHGPLGSVGAVVQALAHQLLAPARELARGGSAQSSDPTPAAVVEAYAPAAARWLAAPCVALASEVRAAQPALDQRDMAVFYADLLLSPAGQAKLFRRFPVLSRLLESLQHKAATAAASVCERARLDAHALATQLGARPYDTIRQATVKGDHHPGGETLLLALASGKQLMYKPRPSQTEAVMGDLLALWNQSETDLPLTIASSVLRHGYAWSEFVVEQLPADAVACSRFGERVGAYLALVYGLCGVDFHRYNFVFRGEVPVPVDFEALFYRKFAGSAEPVARFMDRYGGDWLFSTQMLPLNSTDPLNVIGPREHSREGQLVQMPRERYQRSVIAGFKRAYGFLRARRSDIAALARNCPDLQVRCIARSTTYYLRVLSRSLSLEALADGATRERTLDPIWYGSQLLPGRARLRLAEREALLACDVPRFFARFDSLHATTDTGVELGQALETSGELELARRLDGLSDDDQRQRLGELQLAWDLIS